MRQCPTSSLLLHCTKCGQTGHVDTVCNTNANKAQSANMVQIEEEEQWYEGDLGVNESTDYEDTDEELQANSVYIEAVEEVPSRKESRSVLKSTLKTMYISDF